ncbi:glycoside hydrolase family 15 protein [soil metagenome]
MRIEDYGFLSDTQTAALVGRNGSIDWLCMPRFDSAACFAKLLGDEENGFWKIAPSGEVVRVKRSYRDHTLILETEFETENGRVRLTDCLPIRDEYPDVVRIVEGLEGRVKMSMELVIRFEYGTIVPWVRADDGGILAVAGPDALLLRSDVKTYGEGFTTKADFTVRPGEKKAFVLTWFPSHIKRPKAVKSDTSVARTERYWSAWAKKFKGTHEWADAVKRSLMVLKGLTFAPTGGIVAAATTSLPELIGGARNWDYRFCWLRDATFTLYSLLEAGYVQEAESWRDWLLRAIAGKTSQLQIMYGAAGERDLTERELPNLKGYENSRPVRIGNAAVNQFQLDVYGELVDTMHQARKAGMKTSKWSRRMLQLIVEFVAENWKEPDEGIWEVRGGRRHFVHSKMMAWVALDRAVKSCRERGLTHDAERWGKVRDRIHRQVCRQGYNREVGAFTQSYGDKRLDASLLMMPLIGFLPPEDPRVVSTIEAIQRDLMVDGFLLRYRRDASNTSAGLQPSEGAFLPCTFWLADCLHLIGRRDEAREIFERLLGLRNDLGLLAEEYDPCAKRMLGNFPQAFSHVALINTASNLSRSRGPAKKRGESG